MHLSDMHHTNPYHGRYVLLISYGCHENVGILLCRGLKEFVELNFFSNWNLSTFTYHEWKRWWTECEQHKRWWKAKAVWVLRAEEEQISKESRSERKKESLRIEETVNLTTKSKSLLFVIMHSHRRGSPSSEGRRSYNKDDDQVSKLFKDVGALDQTSLLKKETTTFM